QSRMSRRAGRRRRARWRRARRSAARALAPRPCHPPADKPGRRGCRPPRHSRDRGRRSVWSCAAHLIHSRVGEKRRKGEKEKGSQREFAVVPIPFPLFSFSPFPLFPLAHRLIVSSHVPVVTTTPAISASPAGLP